MKRFKKVIALLTAALFCVLPILSQPITAEAAEEPITYYLKYLPEDGEWRYQQLTAWDPADNNGPLYHVWHHIKDGDTLVIDGAGQNFDLDLYVRLANLTVINVGILRVNATGIDEYYQHNGVSVLNADVKNAYVYNDSVCNFNKNVSDLRILGSADINASVGCLGTVGHLLGKSDYQTFYECYNIAAGQLILQDGSFRTESKYYSTTAPTASKPATSAPATGNNNSGAYDDVPKTGSSNMLVCLMAIAVVCFCSVGVLKKNR